MRVGVIGLGKLGLPVALALEAAGHEVAGWDASPRRRALIAAHAVPEATYEPHLADLLEASSLRLSPVAEACRWADILLITVQTPHHPDFEGVTPLTRPPQDFDYSFLRAAVSEVAATGTDALVVIVSTCLPGTFDREIRPFVGKLRMAYHPLFIAMGSVVDDFRDPEFVLVGHDRAVPPLELYDLYDPVLGDPGFELMSITSAELTKVAYNAAIGYKLMLANGIGELADRVGANADDVMDTLKLADKRIVSTAYMTPGMGDGGGCHPRDQIALSWLAGETAMSCDPFGYIAWARERHADWLADEWARANTGGLPPIMLGSAYKANTPIRTGSHAALVLCQAREEVVTATDAPLDTYPVACYFLATPHDHFLSAPIPPGSVVVDPWGMFPERDGVEVVRLGRRA